VFIGWDWATETHDVTVMDASGTCIARWEPAHSEEGFAKTLACLRKHGAPADLPVAIGTTRLLAVDRRLSADHPVVPVHPNAFHAMRARWGASKAKTDAGDSLGQVIGEIGPILERARTCEQLIAEAGVVPVTRASGKSRVVAFRFATNRRARIALTAFADNSRHGSTWAVKIYNDVRARKKRHPYAIRILARAWLRVMWAC
jgi:hypothetical protein